MHITVPESLEYAGAFDDIFDAYTESRRLVHVKTTSLGSLNRLTYDIMLRRAGEEKAFIDALRCGTGIWRSVSCSAPPRATSCEERRASL